MLKGLNCDSRPLQARAGDVVHMRGVVICADWRDGNALVRVTNSRGCDSIQCAPSEIVHVETRPLQVGDKVKGPRTDLTLQILAIVGSHAWTCAAETVPGTVLGSTYPLASLERV